MGFGSQAGGGGDARARRGIALFGDANVLHAFDLLPPKLQKKYGRRAVTKAGRRVARSAKRKVTQRTGALKKSLGVKARLYKGTGTYTAIVGPREVGRATKARRIAKTMRRAVGHTTKHEPARIAHLVEFGHGGPHAAAAKPFLRPAFDENAQLCITIIAAEIEMGLQELGLAYRPDGW